jgi:hypothetical protein
MVLTLLGLCATYDCVEDRLNVLCAYKHDQDGNQHTGRPKTFDLNLAEAELSAGHAF